ncbi:hypothetical protein VC03_00340 [Sneathia vaginalis]|uniref:Major outer membrane protein n=1 Tax=Sneathia vaginalis TaxID=187101 RepID=A0A0E3ZBA3_9FUSO|nr:hypothetical protein [Sneathia vaginalis]AKC95046.1 hypothetical protein VC03_00340 [Sneathia vaginalis]
MKKTLLLTSLVASMVAMAGTTGSVEAYNENEATFVNGAPKPTFEAKNVGVKTEVKVNGTGFSFGGDLRAEDLKLGEVKRADYLNHSSVWAKYELPELTKGLNMYVKGTVSPKFADKDTNEYKFDGSAELEGQVSYKYDVLTFGLNSKTNFPFRLSERNTDYGKDVKSTHKVFVESEEKKDVFVKGLKDVKASLEIKHNYAKVAATPGARVDYVKGNAELAYDGVKDLRIDGKVDFTVNVNGPKKLDNVKLGDYNLEDLELGGVVSKIPVDFVHTYNAKLTYTGVKGLTLAVAPFISHSQIKNTELKFNLLGEERKFDKTTLTALNNINTALRFDNVMYGASLNAQYKMLNDQLTLTGKALLAGDSLFINGLNAGNLGVVSLGANVKYDYKVSDKFTVSPEADAKLDLYIVSPTTAPLLTLTPKVSVEYKPTDTLTLKGSVEAPVKFGPTGQDTFGYLQTQLKTSLNLKYEWK